MKREIIRTSLAALLYFGVDVLAKALLVMPDNPLVNMANFLPPLLGLMWGPSAAVGSMLGALGAEYADLLPLPQILQEKGTAAFLWESLRSFCNCGLWAFVAAWLPWRLWHSILVRPDEPLFALRPRIILKYVFILFVTTLTTSLLCAMSADETYILHYIGRAAEFLGSTGGYAFVCFVNDFNMPVFFGLIGFFFLVSRDYPFRRPAPVTEARPGRQRAFDILWIVSVLLTTGLCHPSLLELEGLRLTAGLLLCTSVFRPLSPPPRELNEQERRDTYDGIAMERMMAALFYGFLFLLFLALDVSGFLYGLDEIDTWLQFNFECITMMNVAIVALLYMMLRYRRSIMTNFVMLEVVTVFVSAFALGAVCFFITGRITSRDVETELSEMSVICRERLKRTFDGIQVSVEAYRNLALAQLESYDRLAEDAAYREDYLRRTEQLFSAVAANTDGTVAFYMRCNPDFAGPLGGFSWGREKNRWEGAAASFSRRRPIDLSLYDPSDEKNVGWYYIPTARRSATWIEPYIDPTFQAYVISYVIPIYAQEKLVGVVGMDIDFDYLVHEVRRMSSYGYGDAYLRDRNGHILYHKDIPQGAPFRPDSDCHEMETYLTNGIWLGIATPMRNIYAERNNLLMHFVGVMLLTALLVSFLSVGVAARGIRPMMALTEAAQKIAAGNLDVELPENSGDELGTLTESIREMVSKLEIYVYRDKLTGLRNTTAYARKCGELTTRAGDAAPYAVVVFDVNFLKQVNDTFGHDAGNELLRRAAGVIGRIFENSAVFRIGGDEFAAILEAEDYDRREELLVAFDAAVAARHFLVQDTKIRLSIARGLGVWRPGLGYETVFREADEAMYINKAAIKKEIAEQEKGNSLYTGSR